MIAAFLPFAGGLSLSSIFHIRDLSMFFWPRHLWIREALFSGHFPAWDPYAAGGQPAFPDALYQLFLPPVLLLRLLPAALGFNLIVALPFPLAALGTWLLLRRRFAPVAATAGAIAFAASGAVLATGDFPNMSWSVAWIPWILWAVDNDRAASNLRSFALVALFIALQMLSGEPVTTAGALAVAAVYALVTDRPSASFDPRALPTKWRTQVRPFTRLVASTAAAAVVAAVQLVPMALAARESPRAFVAENDFWSLHPLWLLESVLPHLFGDTFAAPLRLLPWIEPLNSDREPFFFSLYLGPLVLLLAAAGAVCGNRRWRNCWLLVAAGGLICGLGSYTPAYPLLQRIVPLLGALRFPAKFFVFVSLSVAMLAASGTAALYAPDSPGTANGERGTASPALRALTIAGGVSALLTALTVAVVLAAPFATAQTLFRVASHVGVTDPVAGAEFLLRGLPPAASRLLLLLAAATLLSYLAWTTPRARSYACAALIAVALGDLVLAGRGVNPVFPAAELSAPSWASAVPAGERYYIGAKFRGAINALDRDLPLTNVRTPEGLTVAEGQSLLSAFTVMTPAPWHVREFFSYDLPQLWSAEFATVTTRFEQSDRTQRLELLERTGVRYCFLGDPPRPGETPIAQFTSPVATMSLFDCAPEARRAFIASSVEQTGDRRASYTRFIDPALPARAAVVEGPLPPAAGAAGAPLPANARIVQDDAQEVVVDAATGADGGYLVLLDTYDKGWRADVDGTPAPIVRANLLFRAVHLAPGRHTVRFVYRPLRLWVPLGVSLAGALALAALALAPVRARSRVLSFRMPGSRTA